MDWPSFSKTKFTNIISKYNNLSIPGSNHISWSHMKVLIKDKKYITNFYINLSVQPTHFKKSMFIIISKPNKLLYNTPKTF